MSAVLPSLARIEAWRVARHPGILLGVLAALALLPAVDASGVVGQDHVVVLGILTFLVGFLAVDRVRRDGAEELYDALPAPPAVRTAAVLLSMGVAAALAAAIAVVTWVAVVGLDGEVAGRGGFTARPSVLELLQTPFLILAFGCVGVFLGRWTQRPVAAPLLMLVLLMGPIGWSIPWVLYQTPELAPGDWVLGDAAWHLVFLGGVSVMCAGLALLRDDRRRPVHWLVLVAGAAALAAGAALQ
jgi:hypothetical protein